MTELPMGLAYKRSLYHPRTRVPGQFRLLVFDGVVATLSPNSTILHSHLPQPLYSGCCAVMKRAYSRFVRDLSRTG
jgi:hypothetical protein